jgi:diaminopimelate epimerase
MLRGPALDSQDPRTYNPAMSAAQPQSALAFRKMNGLGNDFVVLDARRTPVRFTAAAAGAIADRRRGVGCDQILIIEPPRDGGDVFMAIRNADGGEVQSCGNGSRAVARLLFAETGKDRLTIETLAGPVVAWRAEGDLISVDMGKARTDWREIPLAQEKDTLHLGIGEGPLQDPVGVSMGNPHAVFFVPDAGAVDLAAVGPKIEHHPLFPERTNVEVAQVIDRGHLRMRVWERGAGITLACGTGACAGLVAAARRGLAARAAVVTLDGGDLAIAWRDDGHVIMTGPAEESFHGTLDASLSQGLQV